MNTNTATLEAPAAQKTQRFLPQGPVVKQDIILKAKLRKLEVGDSVQFRAASGGIARLVKVIDIRENQKSPNQPRLFVAKSKLRPEEEILLLETQVTHVIHRSKDEYEDLILQDSI